MGQGRWRKYLQGPSKSKARSEAGRKPGSRSQNREARKPTLAGRGLAQERTLGRGAEKRDAHHYAGHLLQRPCGASREDHRGRATRHTHTASGSETRPASPETVWPYVSKLFNNNRN